MPSGEIHGQDSIIIAVQAVAQAYIMGGPGDLRTGLVVAAGALSGLFLSPDLDQDGRTQSEILLIRHVPLIGHGFFLFWYPYAVLFPHRSIYTHSPIIGTVGRLLYMFAWMTVLYFFGYGLGWVSVGTDVLARLAVDAWPVFRLWLLGLAISDTMHWLRDTWTRGGYYVAQL